MTKLLLKASAILAASELAAMCLLNCSGLMNHPFSFILDPALMLLLAVGPLYLLLRGEKAKLEKQEILDSKLHLIINDLWSASLHTLSTEALLGKILAAVIENSPISLQRKGGIFLVEDGELRLKADIGFSDEQRKLCSSVPSGRCLCGLVLQNGETIYSGTLGPEHHIRPAGILPHGHYCLPIKSAGQVIGAMTLYLDPGHLRARGEEEFLGLVCGIIARIIEGKKMERSLFQMQKMEALNRFAAGIAHDFNNILGAISGYCSTAARELPEGSQAASDIREISSAVDRGTELTGQLKLFSRKKGQPEATIDVGGELEAVWQMVSRLMGSGIKADLRRAPAALPVKCSRGHLEQILMNLAANARDAMAGNGKFTVETAAEQICFTGTHQCLNAARLTVSDTGQGIPEAAIESIFEPFFTTKPEGQGSGLGLSIVNGLVHQLGGEILVQSSPGKGTRFDIYLPLDEGSAAK